jgi:hypothetical protein
MAKETAGPADILVDWLQRDRQVIEGLDHLGIEVVSINLYGLLLPGITNVTDRVRYHTFYPWVLDQFAERPARGRRAWREWIRSLDFALALASVAHEQSAEESESAIVGAVTARRLLRDADEAEMVDFRSYVELNEKGGIPSNAYFQNGEGGFGQYYKGPASELGVFVEGVDQVDPDRQLTNYAGVPLARCAGETFDLLLDIAARRKGRVRDLARVGGRVSLSAIPEGSQEERLLRQLVLEGETDLSKGQVSSSRLLRRRSMQLALHYVAACDAATKAVPRKDLAYEFRWGCHARRLPDGSPWIVPAELEGVFTAWGSYHRNDTMNYALEALHWACLRHLDDQPMRPTRLAREVVGTGCAAIEKTETWPKAAALQGSVDKYLSACEQPERKNQGEPWGIDSTWSWVTAMEAAVAAEDDAAAVGWAVRVLARLATDRGPINQRPFETLAGAEEMAAAHDVTFGRWLARTRTRAQEPLAAFLSDLLLEWVLFRHLRVATRKLASQGVSTFKFRPEEGELLLIAEPPRPTLTTPRLRQAFRFLEDLHYIVSDQDAMRITSAGSALLEGVE